MVPLHSKTQLYCCA